MGENAPPEREGPLAQGADVGAPSKLLSDEDAEGRVGAAAKGNEGAVLEATTAVSENSPHTQEKTLSPKSKKDRKVAQFRVPLAGTPYQPAAISAESLLLETGSSTATIANSNFSGLLRDRLHTIAEPGQLPHAPRSTHALAKKILGGQIVRFESEKERDAVHEECRRITGRGRNMTDQERASKGADDQHPYFRPLSSNVKSSLIGSMVKGVYDKDGLLRGQAKHKQPILNEIQRITMRNGTYASKDGERVLAKVRSLLPAMAPATKAQGARVKK